MDEECVARAMYIVGPRGSRSGRLGVRKGFRSFCSSMRARFGYRGVRDWA